MRWEDERYVRVYTRDTATWKTLPWQARALLPLLMRKLDRAGLMELGGEGASGIAAVLDLPATVVRPGLAALVTVHGSTLRVELVREEDGFRASSPDWPGHSAWDSCEVTALRRLAATLEFIGDSAIYRQRARDIERFEVRG